MIMVFLLGMVCAGTHVLAEDHSGSVLDDLQPQPGQNPNPTSPDTYETETTPGGDVKKPPAPGKDGEPVKYTDKDGDHYWGTDGHLYPWPPPKKIDPKEKPDGVSQGADGAWGGSVEGVGFGGVTVKEKTPEEIKKETEERMKKHRKEQKRKLQEKRRNQQEDRRLKGGKAPKACP